MQTRQQHVQTWSIIKQSELDANVTFTRLILLGFEAGCKCAQIKHLIRDQKNNCKFRPLSSQC